MRKRRILPFPIASVIISISMVLAYIGSTSRPELVPNPLVAALAVGFSFTVLLIPFIQATWDILSILSPEVMGGFGFFVYIAFASLTNNLWPGFAVNPSLFEYLPIGIVLQSLVGFAFYLGAISARGKIYDEPQWYNNPHRIAVVMSCYALFTLYLISFAPRQNVDSLLTAFRSGQRVSWIYSVGTFITLQSMPMIIVAWFYLKSNRLYFFRFFITISLSIGLVFFLVSGSRTYSLQLILLLGISYWLVKGRLSARAFALTGAIGTIVMLAVTSLRVSGLAGSNLNLGTVSYSYLLDRINYIQSAPSITGFDGMVRNVQENIVYHLSDNQTMAMLVRNSDSGMLMGRATLNSLLSALPFNLRPSDYISGTNLIMLHYDFFKQRTTDASYLPDWQMNIGVLGYADFGLVGLIVYPFVLGYSIRWLFEKLFVSKRLGEIGWLLYLPIVLSLWNPLWFGPDSLQRLRLLIFLWFGLIWATRQKTEKARLPKAGQEYFIQEHQLS